MKKIALVIASLVALSSGSAFARGSSGGGYLVGLGLYYNANTDDKATPATTTSKSTYTYLDLDLGYVMSNGLYFGLLYSSNTIDTGAGYSTAVTGYGPSIGWMFGSGWMLKAHYILDATADKATTSTDKWTKGTGIQVDAGYMFPVSSTFHLGANLVYRSVKFANYNDGTTDFSTYTYTKTETLPQLTFTFVF